MPIIPPDTIEEIRSRLDIVELVGEFVPGLQRAGRNMKGRCPFHQERTPSFVVTPERQTFHCFGCGEGGDAFAFLMKIENLSFTEAAEKLAERVGVAIKTTSEPLSPEERQRLKLKELLAHAAKFYHESLKTAGAAEAREYFAGRHLSEKTLADFQLGWAPGRGALVSAATRAGYAKELLVQAGLAAVSSGAARDYFYERVMFPIRDAKGVVVGFGARTMGSAQPKYLNSPETPLFSKSRILYGLDRALPDIRKNRRAILMEGYMDVIAAHQHGLTEACAPLGTALTQEHARLLKRYATDIVIVFDADGAGVGAAVRGAEILLTEGLGVSIATVPSGKDPDEFLHAQGAEAFRKDCLDKAVDLVAFKTELLISREPSPLSAQAKSSIAKQILATIAQSPDEVIKSEWIRRLAQRLDVNEDALRKTKSPEVRPARAPVRGPQAAEAVAAAERQVLELFFKQPELAVLAAETDFRSESGRRIWEALKRAGPSACRALESLEGADKTLASRLLVSAQDLESGEEIVRAALSRLRTRNRLEELKALSKQGKLSQLGLEAEYYRLLTESRRTGVH